MASTSYEQAYFLHLQAHLEYYTAIYSSILGEALYLTPKPLADLRIIDYGAGNGMQAVFLKYVGVGQVVVNDLNESCITSCKALATALNLELDGYLQGDVSALEKINQPMDVLLSTDVIEHIYDLDTCMQEMRRLQPGMLAIFTTASNPFNKLKVRQLRQLQHRDEFINSADPLEEGKNAYKMPYFKRRAQLLAENYAVLSEEEIELLATRSRGLRKDDMFKLTAHYLQGGNLPLQAVAKHNTCDPDTGNWTERILPMNAYKELADKAGYSFYASCGFYNQNGNVVLSWIKRTANYFIKHFPFAGKFMAPYLVLVFKPVKTPVSILEHK
ncbi:class I SAM-dependent methyltransferase [Flavihumibacter sp. CACIAM 22H1]|uniref:class I SAM-dependent methyltransferase n=1 Tax=Flavihumibacter sp. CACIAM 22H1 TaxID=1812911 RepID=UPI0025BAB725|nr:class I SAM-dependent methyltransferase [Flavihumibacter sp. CACIAM 22H1]